MGYVNRLAAAAKEIATFNDYVRIISNAIYRAKFKEEAYAIKKYCTSNKDNLIGINASPGYMYEHIRELVNAINIDDNLESLLVGPTKWPENKFKKDTYNFLSKTYNIEYGVNLFSHPWLKKVKVDAYIETAISTFASEITCPKILYTHGMAGLNFSKDYKHVQHLGKYDAVFLNGPLHKKAILAAHKTYGGKLPDIYEIGYLRGDRLTKTKNSFDKKEFLRKLDLPDITTVTYAPTWGEFSSITEWIDPVVEICSKLGVNLLLKLHPIMLLADSTWETCGIDWTIKLKEIVALNYNTKTVVNNNVDDVLLASDVLISDVSGMAIEFMTLEKPVVFLPADKYFNIYGSDRPEVWCRPNYEIRDKSGLKQEIMKAISGNHDITAVDQLVYNRGNSVNVMMDTIKKIIK